MPGNFDTTLVDAAIQVNDSDAIAAAKELLRTEARFVGSYSGCIVSAAVTYREGLQGTGKNIVAILPDLCQHHIR